jgi:hypothetical protein
MNVISAPATIQLKRRRRFGLIVALVALAAGVTCALAFAVDWNATKSQANSTSRAAVSASAGGWSGLADPATGIPLSAGIVGLPAAVSESAGGWSGLADPATGIPLSAGIVGLPATVSESAGGWSGLADPATGIPLSAGIIGLPTSAVRAGLNPDAR